MARKRATARVDDDDPVPLPKRGPETVGSRLRVERERQGISLRELARRLDVSASLISQVELGRATPSVGTLYAIVNELGISLDEVFDRAPVDGDGFGGGRTQALTSVHPGRSFKGAEPVVRHDERKAIQLDSGVRWERLTSVTEDGVDFLFVDYDVGGASCADDSLMRHAGREYGHVTEGRLGVTVGFETYELGPGDSISFNSTTPHRLFNAGDVPARGVWFVVGRGGDARMSPS
jgi:transcriptional regulator with XRE-family HTH domain